MKKDIKRKCPAKQHDSSSEEEEEFEPGCRKKFVKHKTHTQNHVKATRGIEMSQPVLTVTVILRKFTRKKSKSKVKCKVKSETESSSESSSGCASSVNSDGSSKQKTKKKKSK